MPAKTDRPSRRRERSRGQSLVEFAIVLPIILLLTMIAIDFGRLYLGYINLQQMARSGAAFAGDHASAWDSTPDAADQARYRDQIVNDARFINCELPTDGGGNPVAPPPVFSPGYGLGAQVEVTLSCNFEVLTPIISQILGGQILVGATAVFPVREGAVGSAPGGGGGTAPAPVADFIGSPASGWAPLTVYFTDLSLNGPTYWEWTFEGIGNVLGLQNPGPQTFGEAGTLSECVGPAGTECKYDVRLRVSNTGGSNTSIQQDYIKVTVPPATGPIAEFTANRTSGDEPLPVTFSFVDLRGGAVTYDSYVWDFDASNGTGDVDATGPSVTHQFTTAGVYSVTLTVTAGLESNSLTKFSYINVVDKICVVPDFVLMSKQPEGAIQDLWEQAGFSTDVEFSPANGNYTIQRQSITGGTVDPTPDGCASNVMLYAN